MGWLVSMTIKEHSRHLRIGQTDKFAIAYHCCLNGHQARFIDTKDLYHSDNWLWALPGHWASPGCWAATPFSIPSMLQLRSLRGRRKSANSWADEEWPALCPAGLHQTMKTTTVAQALSNAEMHLQLYRHFGGASRSACQELGKESRALPGVDVPCLKRSNTWRSRRG